MFHSRMCKIRTFILTFFFVHLVGCSQAPIIIGSVVEPGSIEEEKRVVKLEGLLREGSYCVDISFKDPNALLSWQSADLKRFKPTFPVTIKYIVQIPDTGLSEEVSIDSDSSLVAAYNEKEFYHSFSLNVEAISSYRADVFITVIFSGSEKGLETYSYKISISEWSCK